MMESDGVSAAGVTEAGATLENGFSENREV